MNLQTSAPVTGLPPALVNRLKGNGSSLLYALISRAYSPDI